MQLTIIDQNGFKKRIDLEKAVTRIGSSPASDIPLQSPEIAPYQFQILYSSENPAQCKIVNFSEETTLFSNGAESLISPYATADARAGDEIRIKGFRLQFELPYSAGTVSTSTKINATLAMNEPVLRPETVLVGRILLKNAGEKTSSQFEIDVYGLPDDCYQVDPIPLMYPGAQEEVNIRFFHRQTHPPAGFQSVTISISAPSSYPGEQVSIQQSIYVSPLANSSITILDDMPAPEKAGTTPAPAPVEADASATEPTADSTEENPTPQPVAAQPEPSPAQPAPQPESPAIQPTPAAPKIVTQPKVVRAPSESFWDDEEK